MTGLIYIAILVFLFFFGNYLMGKVDHFIDSGHYKGDTDDHTPSVKKTK